MVAKILTALTTKFDTVALFSALDDAIAAVSTFRSVELTICEAAQTVPAKPGLDTGASLTAEVLHVTRLSAICHPISAARQSAIAATRIGHLIRVVCTVVALFPSLHDVAAQYLHLLRTDTIDRQSLDWRHYWRACAEVAA